ncbi:cell wall-binding repeat-containing protein [Microcella sp.]
MSILSRGIARAAIVALVVGGVVSAPQVAVADEITPPATVTITPTSGNVSDATFLTSITVSTGCPTGYRAGSSTMVAQGATVQSVANVRTAATSNYQNVYGTFGLDGTAISINRSISPTNNYVSNKSLSSLSTPLTAGAFELRVYCFAGATPNYTTDKWFKLALELDGSGNWSIAATPDPEQVINRLQGSDRYATAVEVSKEFESFGGAEGSVAYVATGANFPDALVAAAAAGSQQAPLLLTPTASMPAVVIAELQRLDPARVVIVGGTGAVSAAVRSQITGALPDAIVDRLGGASRYETARLVVQDAFPGVDSVYVATGRNFPDALAAAAAAVRRGAAVMITDGNAPTLGADALAVVQPDAVTSVYIAGGTGAVSAGIQTQLNTLKGAPNVTRYAGANRYETSLLLNRGVPGGFGPTAYLATGTGFADALGGAALAGATGSALYTVPPTCVPSGVRTDLEDYARSTQKGDRGALSAAVLNLTVCPS